jgi:hypothetical protein
LESKIKEGTLTESVVHYLAGMLESRRRVSYIFTGSTNLENRKVDFWKSLLGKSIYRKISYLSAADTQRLITEPLKEEIEYPCALITSIYRLTGGHPFYVQVICQNLIDLLIEETRNDPSGEDLEAVIKDIIENPLPQMIYSWNSLSDWTKFALSSLAGNLAGAQAESEVPAVFRFLQKSKIALPFKRERLNVFLEEAYEKEFLRKSDSAAYAFRMDLYRRWIRKEHSIWKVIKEVNLEVKKQKGWVKYALASGAALAGVIILFIIFLPWKQINTALGVEKEKISGIVLAANQSPFRVAIDGSLTLTSEGRNDPGTLPLPPLETGKHDLFITNPVTGEKLQVEITVESSTKEIGVIFTKDVAAHTFGSLFLSTTPDGARIFIDGQYAGDTPKVIGNLVVGNHNVEVVRDGYKTLKFSAQIKENAINEQKLMLAVSYGSLSLNVRPTAKVYLDGNYLVDTPIAQPLAVQTGKHVLLVVNESLGVREEIAITVLENETTKIEREYK